jgi:hypothetical protein
MSTPGGTARRPKLALQAIPGQGRDLIEEFGRHVIGKL